MWKLRDGRRRQWQRDGTAADGLETRRSNLLDAPAAAPTRTLTSRTSSMGDSSWILGISKK
jgi:hypothetical protein